MPFSVDRFHYNSWPAGLEPYNIKSGNFKRYDLYMFNSQVNQWMNEVEYMYSNCLNTYLLVISMEI